MAAAAAESPVRSVSQTVRHPSAPPPPHPSAPPPSLRAVPFCLLAPVIWSTPAPFFLFFSADEPYPPPPPSRRHPTSAGPPTVAAWPLARPPPPPTHPAARGGRAVPTAAAIFPGAGWERRRTPAKGRCFGDGCGSGSAAARHIGRGQAPGEHQRRRPHPSPARPSLCQWFCRLRSRRRPVVSCAAADSVEAGGPHAPGQRRRALLTMAAVT